MSSLEQRKTAIVRRHVPPARSRAQVLSALYLVGAMGVVALPAGIGATRFAQDALVGITAAAMAVLVLVAVLNTLGILGGR